MKAAVKPFSSIPGPRALPVIGNLWQYKLGYEEGTSFHNAIEKLHQKYGPVVKEKLGHVDIVHVFSPDDARTVYKHEGKTPHIMPLNDSVFIFRKRANLALGLGNSNGEEWYKLRNSLRHLLLTPKGISNFMKDTDEVALDLIENLKSKRQKNGLVPKLRTELSKWSLEASGLMCFGKRNGYMTEANRKEAEKILRANKSVFYLSTLLKFAFPYYEHYSPIFKELQTSEFRLLGEIKRKTKVALSEIDEMVKNEGNVDERYQLLVSLLKREDLTEGDIYILTQSLFTDGLTTTVPSLIHNLYCLALHQDKQEKAYEEVKQLMKPGDTVSNETLARLNYLRAVIKETFRFYPIGTEISRIVKSDMVLSGYEIPSDTHVNLNMNVNFKSEKYFDDPESYLPERWLRENVSNIVDPFVLTPFGFGARTCIGRRFAEQNLYTAISQILTNFKLVLEPSDASLNQVFNILLYPNGNINIRFLPR